MVVPLLELLRTHSSNRAMAATINSPYCPNQQKPRIHPRTPRAASHTRGTHAFATSPHATRGLSHPFRTALSNAPRFSLTNRRASPRYVSHTARSPNTIVRVHTARNTATRPSPARKPQAPHPTPRRRPQGAESPQGCPAAAARPARSGCKSTRARPGRARLVSGEKQHWISF